MTSIVRYYIMPQIGTMAALNDSQFLCLPTVKQIDGVCMAVAGSPDRQPSRLDFFFLPLDPQNKSLDEWCKYEGKHPTLLYMHMYRCMKLLCMTWQLPGGVIFILCVW